MRTGSGRFALAAFLCLLALPARADESVLSAQQSRDLCNYLKDVDEKTDKDCAPDAILALRSRDQSAFAAKLALAAKRKTDVTRAYELLKASPEKVESDSVHLEPPINERTFPAWLGDKALDLKPVYARLLEAQKRQLESQKAAEASPERKAEIERALAANQTKITALDKIKDPSQLSCFLGDTCGNRGAVIEPGGQALGTGRRAWTQADFDRANAEASRGTVAPGGKIEGEVPQLINVADQSERKPSSSNGSPLLPMSIPLGLGLVGYGVYRARKEDGTPQTDMPSGDVYQPTFASDPVGVIAENVFDAKIAIERHPVWTLGAAGAVVIGAFYFGGPMLVGAGGAAEMTPMAATAGAVPASGAPTAAMGGAGTIEGLSHGAKTLARIGGAVAAVKVTSSGISLTKAQDTGSGHASDRDKKKEEIERLLKEGNSQDPADKGKNLTKAGRNLAKHSVRPDSKLPRINGSPERLNQAAQEILKGILENPNSKWSTSSNTVWGNVTDVVGPDGVGVRYGPNGEFLYFLD